MKFSPLLLLALFPLFSGCASTMKGPTPAQVSAATFDPVPADIEARIKAQYGVMLKDPYSAQYQFGVARKAYIQVGSSKKVFGYIIPVIVNARNSYGGYTGGQLYHWAWAEGNLYNATNTVKFGGAVMLP